MIISLMRLDEFIMKYSSARGHIQVFSFSVCLTKKEAIFKIKKITYSLRFSYIVKKYLYAN